MKTILTVLAAAVLAAGPVLAAGGGGRVTRGEPSTSAGAGDVRSKCREAIQKSSGQGKDAKVSRKAIDRCVENGGQS